MSERSERTGHGAVDEILRAAAHDLRAEVRAGTDAGTALAEVEAAGPGPRSRRWLAVAAALVVVLGLAATVLVVAGTDDPDEVTRGPSTTTTQPEIAGPAPGQAEGLAITVTPAQDLVDGGEVRVTAEGLPQDGAVQVELVMCVGDAMARAPGLSRCESSGVVQQPVTPTGGRIDTAFAVEQVLTLQGIEIVDCARDAVTCAIGIAVNRGVPAGSPEEPLGPQLVGIVGVGFAPLEPAEAPRLTVEPAAGLAHGQEVTLEGEGFSLSVDDARLCAPSLGADVCTWIPLAGDAPGQMRTDRGAFRVTVPVWRAFPWAEGVVDCAEVACALSLTAEDGRTAAPVPLAFSAAPPTPEPPTLEVTPTTGLRPGDPVTVTARGVVPGEEVMIFACALGGNVASDRCGRSTSLDPMVAGEDGVATITLPAVDPLQYGETCTEPGACALGLGSFMDGGDPLLQLVVPVPVQFVP